ncbi:unnamed protein product, partial [Anisakis simplex]|uniref:Uncharacterized protein n=1 Tax=Anisakis simplex TaxID=6269 RepID=A0A0M3JAV3_ANISI
LEEHQPQQRNDNFKARNYPENQKFGEKSPRKPENLVKGHAQFDETTMFALVYFPTLRNHSVLGLGELSSAVAEGDQVYLNVPGAGAGTGSVSPGAGGGGHFAQNHSRLPIQVLEIGTRHELHALRRAHQTVNNSSAANAATKARVVFLHQIPKFSVYFLPLPHRFWLISQLMGKQQQLVSPLVNAAPNALTQQRIHPRNTATPNPILPRPRAQAQLPTTLPPPPPRQPQPKRRTTYS